MVHLRDALVSKEDSTVANRQIPSQAFESNRASVKAIQKLIVNRFHLTKGTLRLKVLKFLRAENGLDSPVTRKSSPSSGS